MVVYIRRMLFSHPRGVDDYLPNNYEKKTKYRRILLFFGFTGVI